MKKLLAIALAAVLLSGCTRTGTLTVINKSPLPITNIVVTVSGLTLPFEALAPGAQAQVRLDFRPSGTAAAMTLDFDGNGKHISDKIPSDSWDGMKEVIMTVNADFHVTVKSATTF